MLHFLIKLLLFFAKSACYLIFTCEAVLLFASNYPFSATSLGSRTAASFLTSLLTPVAAAAIYEQPFYVVVLLPNKAVCSELRFFLFIRLDAAGSCDCFYLMFLLVPTVVPCMLLLYFVWCLEPWEDSVRVATLAEISSRFLITPEPL